MIQNVLISYEEAAQQRKHGSIPSRLIYLQEDSS